MKLKHSGVQSDSNRLARTANKDNDMATEGQRYTGNKSPELMVKI
jgi:hypothetical protein